MTAAIFFDFTRYQLKAANQHKFNPVRWWESPAARAKDTAGPWWQETPKAKDVAKGPANKGFWDWLTK